VGLILMESRVRLLGGSLAITSEAGAGTTVAFTIPENQGQAV
jgi:signal transduction histidine kinase